MRLSWFRALPRSLWGGRRGVPELCRSLCQRPARVPAEGDDTAGTPKGGGARERHRAEGGTSKGDTSKGDTPSGGDTSAWHLRFRRTGDKESEPRYRQRRPGGHLGGDSAGGDTFGGGTYGGGTSRGDTLRDGTYRGATSGGDTFKDEASTGATSRGATFGGDTLRGATSRGDISGSDTFGGDTSRGEASRGATLRGATFGGGTLRGATSGGDTLRGATSGGATSRGATSGGDIFGGATSRGEASRGDTSRGDTSRGDTYGGDIYGGATSGGDTLRDDTSRGDTSRDDTSGAATSRGATSGGDTSKDETSTGDTSGAATSRGATFGGDTFGDATSGGDTLKDEASRGDTFGGDTSGGATSRSDTSGGATSGDATSTRATSDAATPHPSTPRPSPRHLLHYKRRQHHHDNADTHDNDNDSNTAAFLSSLRDTERFPAARGGRLALVEAALAAMPALGLERSPGAYKALLRLLPRGPWVPRGPLQRLLFPFPRQQECGLRLLEQMERYGVVPDAEARFLLLSVFGARSRPARKLQRMQFWLPRFRHLDPHPLPPSRPLPLPGLEAAEIGLRRMAGDPKATVTVVQRPVPETGEDEGSVQPLIVSWQGAEQRALLQQHAPSRPVFVEGPFPLWLRGTLLRYFVLRGDPLPPELRDPPPDPERSFYFPLHLELELERGPWDDDGFDVEEAEEGPVFALCVAGAGDRRTLARWISALQPHNPALAAAPVVFRLAGDGGHPWERPQTQQLGQGGLLEPPEERDPSQK